MLVDFEPAHNINGGLKKEETEVFSQKTPKETNLQSPIPLQKQLPFPLSQGEHASENCTWLLATAWTTDIHVVSSGGSTDCGHQQALYCIMGHRYHLSPQQRHRPGASEEARATDTNMDPGTSLAHGLLHGFRQQHRPCTSV